jgi:hypothetical protein
MKLLPLIALLILPNYKITCQTAEDLWANLQSSYQGLSNYVDQGVYTKVIYGTNTTTTTYDYTLAIDSQQNVWHTFSKWETAEADQYKYPWSYSYQKSAGQSEGIMTRYLKEPDPVARTLNEACASLYGVGGGILYDVAGLMFPMLYQDSDDGAQSNFGFDALIRSQDTMINSEECFVLEMISAHWVSEEKIRENERRRDSIISRNPQPYPIPEQPKQVPHENTFHTRYMIRKSDGLICRREVTLRSEGNVRSYSVQTMSPQSDVKGFEKYLWKG